MIPGGRSSAKVIRIVPDDGGTQLVAKVDVPARLDAEMIRFKRYAQRWDTELNPQLHYHAETGLILFGLLESPESPGRPAPTLEEILERVFYLEHYPPYTGPDESELKELINRAIRKLKRLNSQDNDRECARRIAIECSTFADMRNLGMDWTFRQSPDLNERVFDLALMASRRVNDLADCVIVHGDVQLRNILVRDGREPHFIDYANCGPGHPCYDLVRLESAVLYYCFRMNGDETDLAALLIDILSGCDETAILDKHPAFCTSITNRVAIHACISCRLAAIELAEAKGGSEDDYLAMKYVLACQSLFLIHLQAGVVRSQLAAALSHESPFTLVVVVLLFHINILVSSYGSSILNSPAVAGELRLHLTQQDIDRLHELAAKYRDDALTEAEKDELGSHLRVSSFLDLMHGKARRSLGRDA